MKNDTPRNDTISFRINEIAKQIGVVPATIRNWEKQGLFTAKRSENGYRVYDFKDLETLREIKQHSKDQRMGINAIRVLYGSPSETHQREQSVGAVSRRLMSEKWKDTRLKHGFLLDDVAKEVGISPSYLSKIENSHANVSLEVLQKLAAFYGESLLYYVGKAAEESHLVRKGKGESFSIGLEGVMVESVVAMQNILLSTLIYTVEPGSASNGVSQHGGEEYVYILSGKVEFTLNGNEVYALNTGDSLTYRSREPHSWRNNGNKVARILWVYTRGPEI